MIRCEEQPLIAKAKCHVELKGVLIANPFLPESEFHVLRPGGKWVKRHHHLLEVAVSGTHHRKRNRERKKNEDPGVEDRNVDTMARIVENLQEQSSTAKLSRGVCF